MKKLITLSLFAGCITTGFAQSGHHQQSNNQPNGNGYKSQQNSGNNRDQYAQNTPPCSRKYPPMLSLECLNKKIILSNHLV
jgi:hypothetical protein